MATVRTPVELFDEDRPGWSESPVVCAACGFFWVAHVHRRADLIECPQCKYETTNPVFSPPER